MRQKHRAQERVRRAFLEALVLIDAADAVKRVCGAHLDACAAAFLAERLFDRLSGSNTEDVFEVGLRVQPLEPWIEVVPVEMERIVERWVAQSIRSQQRRPSS